MDIFLVIVSCEEDGDEKGGEGREGEGREEIQLAFDVKL
jgi:hypothetical protein